MVNAIPRGIVVNDFEYQLLETSPGQVRWQVQDVPSQPGDGGKPVPHAIQFEGGFGATNRYSTPNGGQTAPTHHDYGQNFDVRYAGIGAPAPRITYLSLASQGAAGHSGFRFGGSIYGQLGGGVGGKGGNLGGGSFGATPWAITEFGGFLYFHAGSRTYTVDPSQTPPTLVETKDHPATARIYSGDVFDNQMVVALGSNTDAAYSSTARGSNNATQWAVMPAVKRNTFRTGKAGRLYSSAENLVYQVFSGQDPSLVASYLPTTGESITDETHPVRSLEEFLRGLVAGTDVALRTFDPDAGFQGRVLMAPSKLSPSDFAGRSLSTWGDKLMYATTRAVWMFQAGQRPIQCGPELMEQNESPYVGGEPGIPDAAGDWLVWPFYFPATGDSVIFWVRDRKSGEPGVGPLVWQDMLYLQGRECRVVKYWGGTASVKPRLFCGAGSVSSPIQPQQAGWVDLGSGGAPDIFVTDAQPALSATIYTAEDDFGKPTTAKEVERWEFPEVKNADASNYAVVSARADGGSYVDLVKAQSGSNQERVNSTGFQQVFPPTGTPIDGRKLKFRIVCTQASGAATFWQWRGWPIVYLSERPLMTQQVTTLLDARGTPGIEDAEVEADRLRTLAGGQKVEIKHTPSDTTVWGKVVQVRTVQVEVEGAGGRKANRTAVELTYREIATAQ